MSQKQRSIIPNLQAERYPEGMLLREKQGPKRMLFFWGLFALLWNGISWPGAIGFILTGTWQTERLAAFVVFLFCVVGLVFIGLFIRQIILLTSFGPAELFIEHLPLRLGENVSLRFKRKLRGSFDIRSMQATFMCQEWVRYRVGTETKTMTELLWSQELPVVNLALQQNREIDMAWAVQIPTDQPPSFSAPDNALEWLITIKVEAAGRPNPTSEFLLPVMPEVVQ